MVLTTEHFEISTLVVVQTENHGHKTLTKRQKVMIGVQFSSSRRIKREDIEELKARYSILDIESDTL